jgi:transcription initiation factor TFIIE subunit alpha
MKKSTDFFTKHFFTYVQEISGRKGVKIINSLYENGDGATDEKIENKTKIKMAEIRSLLNVLHKYGLVEYHREKNLNSGWFTYTWRCDADRALQNFIVAKKREYEELARKTSETEKTMFYKCRKGCSVMPFETAMEKQFRCPKCDSKMNFYDNKRNLKAIETRVKTVKKILENLPPEKNFKTL